MAKKNKLKIIPLGGLDEIGKNMTVIEYGNEMIMVDCGMSFPDDDMPGVDLVINDISYVEKNRAKLKGIFLTHGHEDHIGGLPYFLKQINVPVYGTQLTIGLVEHKLKEHTLLSKVKLCKVKAGDVVKINNVFSVEFIRTNHSIADSVGFHNYTHFYKAFALYYGMPPTRSPGTRNRHRTPSRRPARIRRREGPRKRSKASPSRY